MAILISGGAGYIGSHMAHHALDLGEQVVVVDNLSTGIRKLVPGDAVFVKGDVGEQSLVETLFSRYSIDAVIHFAGSVIVPESVADPLAYYSNNTMVARNLIEACIRGRISKFIFSSTAAVYGTGNGKTVVAEGDLTAPINPYGRSKLMIEWMLQDVARVHDFRFVALRYFNVAGADPKGRTGQSTPKATHLIKRACQAALGRIPRLDIFGTDYPTRDGTGERDYIHVTDLISAHALALNYLRGGKPSAILNCGYGHGTSVREVISAVERISGDRLPVMEGPRRPGDAPALVADNRLISEMLGWRPGYDDLNEIVRGAYNWEQGLGAEDA
ncbi:MAG TPA: UDP-glucose 4-epimerase GalE [Rhizomicrobium sp.]|nr:UDP-glucose 4-epimerase GalE [Rhizomicrobium sp.]